MPKTIRLRFSDQRLDVLRPAAEGAAGEKVNFVCRDHAALRDRLKQLNQQMHAFWRRK